MLNLRIISLSLARLLLVLVAASMVLPAFAQSTAARFPSRAITLVIGFPPGGSNDLIARILAPKLGELLGVPVVVDNKPGASGTIGTTYVVNARPDGYTILLTSTSALAISPHTTAKLPYDPLTDLATIDVVASSPAVLAVNPALPVKSIAELIALSKTRPVSVASAGAGGISHLNIEFMRMESKGNFLHVPYKGAVPAMTDAVGGQVDAIVMDYAPLSGAINQGRLRALITSKQIGSIEMSNLMIAAWYGVMAPARTPKDVIDTLHNALAKTIADPDVKARLAKLDVDTMGLPSAEDAAAYIRNDSARWAAIVKGAGIKPE